MTDKDRTKINSSNTTNGNGQRDSLTASAQPVPARVDLTDYRRRKYETFTASLRWRYENGFPFD